MPTSESVLLLRKKVDISEKNCNISCRRKIVSSWTFLLLKVTEFKGNYNCVIVKTRRYRHTENILLDSEPNRYYLIKINRNSQIHGSFVH